MTLRSPPSSELRDRRPGAATEPDPEGVYSLSPECVAATFDGQVVLYHLDRGRALALGQTAGIIFELIGSRCSVAEIRELLERAYPESAADAGRDLDRTLRYLLRHGALEAPSGAGSAGQAVPV